MHKSKIGLLWVARQSRSDIKCDTSILASSTKHATVQTLHCTNKLIRKHKSEEVTLRFQYLRKDSSLKLVVFSDSSMANLPDGGTQGGSSSCLWERVKDSHLYACSQRGSGELFEAPQQEKLWHLEMASTARFS